MHIHILLETLMHVHNILLIMCKKGPVLTHSQMKIASIYASTASVANTDVISYSMGPL